MEKSLVKKEALDCALMQEPVFFNNIWEKISHIFTQLP
jgi:hypothetical protein